MDASAQGVATPAAGPRDKSSVATVAQPPSYLWHEALRPVASRTYVGRKGGRVTIKDIALHVGVDKSAVSLALRGDRRISGGTRTRIIDAARLLGYVPNDFARSLSGGRSRVIGVMLTDLSNRYFAGPLEEFQSLAETDGFTLSVKFSSWDVERERLGIRQFCGGWVEGIIWAAAEVHSPGFAEMLRMIGAARVPLVALGHIEECHSVGVELKQTITLGLQYLKDLGHRNIGMACATKIAGRRAGLQEYRLDSTRKVAAEMGLQLSERNVFDSTNNTYGGVEIASEICRRPRASWPTAIFTSDDMIGQSLVAGLRALGVKIPSEISVLGMDNAGEIDAHLPLTTVSIEASETGRQAMQLLLDVIDQRVPRSPIQNLLLPPKLIVRATCGKPHA